MILLMGGAGETAEMANRIADEGYRVIVSTATQVRLDVGDRPGVTRRSGRLDEDGLLNLIKAKHVRAVVDATHPFATIVKANARASAESAGVPYLAYERPRESYDYDRLVFVKDHEEAARVAFSFGAPVLLTTGSLNLAPYVAMSRQTGIRVVARVLDYPASVSACKKAGLDDADIIAGRGPFSVAQNLDNITANGIGALVTKQSGAAGGVAEKIEAALVAGLPVVMIERPVNEGKNVFNDMDRLMEHFKMIMNVTALKYGKTG